MRGPSPDSAVRMACAGFVTFTEAFVCPNARRSFCPPAFEQSPQSGDGLPHNRQHDEALWGGALVQRRDMQSRCSVAKDQVLPLDIFGATRHSNRMGRGAALSKDMEFTFPCARASTEVKWRNGGERQLYD